MKRMIVTNKVVSNDVIYAAINPSTLKAIAEIVGPLVVELIGKYWETHQDDVVDELADEALDQIEDQTDEKFSMLKAFIDENQDAVVEILQKLISQKLEGVN